MSVFHLHRSIVLADTLDELDGAVARLVGTLVDEGGAVEWYSDPQKIDEGPNAGRFLQEIRYAKPGAFL